MRVVPLSVASRVRDDVAEDGEVLAAQGHRLPGVELDAAEGVDRGGLPSMVNVGSLLRDE